MAEHCNHTECDRPVRSRGLCITHYNQTQANRHRKVMRPCDCCGKLCAKEARGRRYSGVYCSELCRDYSPLGRSLQAHTRETLGTMVRRNLTMDATRTRPRIPMRYLRRLRLLDRRADRPNRIRLLQQILRSSRQQT